MDQLLCIPEFVDLISSHLDLATLAACVRVCKAWHEICIPHLWHTFGTSPQRPVRFGESLPPSIDLPGNTKFPLYVSENNGCDDPSATTTPVFSMARPEIYPGSDRWDHYQLPTKTMWDRFFGGLHPSPGDEETIAPIVAKYAKHIRCLVVCSRWSFDVCEHVCRQLTSLYFDFSGRGSAQDMTDALILAFVERQSNIQSIRAMRFSPALSNALLRLNRDWLHFDVILHLKDFSNINQLLPHTRTACVSQPAGGFDTAFFRLSRPHLHLRELRLCANKFNHHMLKGILESFPNLRRLTVDDEIEDPMWGWIPLDLHLDNGYSMLIIEESPAWDIRRLIPLLPNLLVFKGIRCAVPVFKMLAQYCPRLMHCRIQGASVFYVPFVPILLAADQREFHIRRTSPENSISRMLASCPDLVSVYCAPWFISPEDIVSLPWVCHKLKTLHCVFGDVPFLSDAEQEVYQSLLERRRDRIAANQKDPQADSQWMSADERAVDRKAQSLRTYIEAIEEQLQRLPEVNLKPHRTGIIIPEIASLEGQMEAAKASVGL